MMTTNLFVIFNVKQL